MKFKIDENLPDECVSILQEAGFEADTVDDENLAGSEDLMLFHQMPERGASFDYLGSRLFKRETVSTSYTSIVIFRTKEQDKVSLLALLRRMVLVLGVRSPHRQLWIVEKDRIRFREE